MKICLVLHKYGIPLDDPCCYPLGFMYISSALKDMGHEVKVLNYNLHDYDFDKEIDGYDRVLFTGFEEFLPYIKEDSQTCKRKGIKTVVGGALATFRPDLMLSYCDTVVIGEGEAVLARALNESGKILGDRPDVNRLPLPDYEGFGIEEYHKRHKIKYMGVLTSRGCLHHCTFCAQTCRFQYRDLTKVFAEIKSYKEKYEITHVIFNDNTLNLNMGRFFSICDMMKHFKLSWSAAIRLDKWSERMALAAKESGCQYLVVGVESLRQEKLDRMNKKITVEEIIRGLDILETVGLNYQGHLLFGFDGETPKDIFSELEMTPTYYKIYPVMLRKFVGTRDGLNHNLSVDEWNYFDEKFKSYAGTAGKYCLPDLQEAI